MRKRLSALLAAAFLLVFSSVALATTPTPTPTPTPTSDENTIIKEHEFTTTEKPFVFNVAPKSIREKNREFFLQAEIEYELISETELFKDEAKEFSKQQNKQNLSVQDESIFPDSVHIDEDGYYGKIQRKNVAFRSRSIDGGSKTHNKIIAYGFLVDPPTPPQSVEIKVKGTTISLPFVKLDSKSTYWQKNHVAKYTLHSDTQDFQINGRSIPMNSDKPEIDGLGFDLLQAMKLDAGAHIIDRVAWNGALSYDGQSYSRTLKFTLKRLVTDYSATYSVTIDKPDSTVYDATATYTGILTKPVPDAIEYLVKAKVTYYADPLPTTTPSPTPEPTPTPEPELPQEEPKKKSGIGGVITFLVVVGILGGGAFFASQWKKKRDSEV